MRLLAIVLPALVVALTACGRAEDQAADTGSTTLTVYAALPFQGPGGPDAEAVANGARLALRDAGGTVGDLVVKLAVLDDSTPAAGRWTPEQAAENARIAVRDRTAIAFLGGGPSGATAISLPILNSAGVLQVSPTSGYVGLTGTQDAEKGEPDKYYPSGVRTFARPIAGDDVQARALLAALQQRDCRRLRVLDDRDVANRGLATAVTRLATAAGMEVVGRDALRTEDVDPVDEARKTVAGAPDCVMVAAGIDGWAPQLFDALHAEDPALELFGGDGLATPSFAAALRPGTQARTHLVGPVGITEPVPAVRAFARRYEEAFGLPARSGALYGHEAMRLVLAAIERAGATGDNRAAVTRALFALGERRSPMGMYRIERSGNATTTAYSHFSPRRGRLGPPRTAEHPPA